MKKFSLVGVNGNAFCVMGYVRKAMSAVGMNKSEIDTYLADAMSGDYDHLLYVSCNMIDKVNERI